MQYTCFKYTIVVSAVARSRILAMIAIARAAESSKPGSSRRILRAMAISARTPSAHNGLMQRQLDALPDSHLDVLFEVVRDAPRLGYAWILAVIEWERRRRAHGQPDGAFPAHGLKTDELWGAISNLCDFAARIRANAEGVGLAHIVGVLDAAVESLTAEMERGSASLQ